MNDFNQSIPSRIIALLFENPVNLSNLHQLWFMNKTQKASSYLDVATEIYYAFIQRNFSYVNWKIEQIVRNNLNCFFQSYLSTTEIQQSFCTKGEFKNTFLVNQLQFNETKDFLCNNLSASDLKLFLIGVQQQLDGIFVVKDKNF